MTIRADLASVEVKGARLLNDISMEVIQGEVLAIVGPNGAGKSTLLSALAGDLELAKGTVFYDKFSVLQLSIRERSLRRSVMSQAQPMVFDFSVEAIVEMGWLYGDHNKYSKDFNSAILHAIEWSNIDSLIGRRFNTLSGGEQKRVHFARALLQIWRPQGYTEPRYLLLDEPLANLDISHEIRILKVIREAAASGIGVLIIMHDLNLAAKFADRIALLHHGKLVKIGRPKSVFSANTLSAVYDVPISVELNPLTISYY